MPMTNTVLQYDSNLNLVNWGFPALAREPRSRRKNKNSEYKLVELFKLHLSDIPDYQKPVLPYGLDYRKAIKDFLAAMRPVRFFKIGKILSRSLLFKSFFYS